jgi:amino-acid N-acetyltransferase
MNTQLVFRKSASTPSRLRRAQVTRVAVADVTYRFATVADAPALHALITSHVVEGHLLPRAVDELRLHATRFVVALREGSIVGCAELAPLSADVAEVRSLVVHRSARALGIGGALIGELQHRARVEGFAKLCAFTHDAGYFVRRGFSIVPHAWVPEKIAHDCHSCVQFRRCGQHAVVLPIATSDSMAPGTSDALDALRG